MSFLVLLLVLWIEKLSNWRQRLQRDSAWLRQLDGAAASRPWRGGPGWRWGSGWCCRWWRWPWC